MPDPLLAPRYVSRFSCIGSACESTCCGGWSITIDQSHHKKIKRALEGSKADREQFDRSVKRVRGEERAKHYALIVLNDKKECNFLDEKKLCGLQGRFGAKLLPDTCATYPRRQSLLDERTEMALSLSCPEAARKALLADDAMELVELGDDTFRPATAVQRFEGRDAYEQMLDPGRMTVLEILSGAESLTSGLATVAALAQVLGDDFGKGKAFDANRAYAAFEEFKQPERARAIGGQVAAIDVPMEVALAPLLRVFAQRFTSKDLIFPALAGMVAAAYGITETLDLAVVAKRYAERRDAIDPIVGARLDAMLKNFAMNHAFTDWFTESSSFAVWVRGLILRTALVRLVVFAHPLMESIANGTATAGDAQALVEKVTVWAVARLGRAIEHNSAFIELLDDILPRTMPGLEHALCVLKV